MNLYELTIKEASEKLKNKEITSTELTSSLINRAKKLDSKVGAYITLSEERAMNDAKSSDDRRVKGKTLSEIDGIPLAIKDIFLTKGIRTTSASKILNDFIPVYESTVTDKLWRSGAVLLGKTNCDEFAMGASTESSAYKTASESDSPTRNPWDLSRIPGGSSGGSAAAVSADLCTGSIGTDTGGSIRQPAGLCGVTGFKPTYGRVSRYGITAMASSLDQAGPITKTVEDSAILLEYISGSDKYDSTCSEKEVPSYVKALSKDISKLRIGVPEEFFKEGVEADVKNKTEESIEVLRKLGAKVSKVSMPILKYALATYYILMPAEVSSNMARYDGIRYGLSALKDKEFAGTIEEVYEKTREDGFGAEVKRRIMLGSYVLSAGYYDAYYKKAQKVRTLVKREFDKIFKEVDLLATPVSPEPAFKAGEKVSDPLQMYLADIMTVPVNPAGLPAISIPAGFVERENKKLPVGLQLIGDMWSEQIILNAGFAYQEETSWHKEKPNLAVS